MPDLGQLYASHLTNLSERYGAILDTLELSVLVVHAGKPQRANPFDDFEWPFKPCPTFAHFSPIREADSYIVFRPGEAPVIHSRASEDIWHSPPVYDSEHWQGHLEWRRTDLAEVGTLARNPRAAVICPDRSHGRALGAPSSAINPALLMQGVHAIRAVKTDYERECIARANAIAARGHVAIQTLFERTAEVSELELHHHYLEATKQNGSDLPYGNIVGLGANAAYLHHHNYGTVKAPAGSLLVDAGASFAGYAADITRTSCKGKGSAAGRFRELIERMDSMQLELCDELQAGIDYQDLHNACHRKLAAVLRDSGLASGADDELTESGVTRAFLPHGLGHSLGLQVHDVGCRDKAPRHDNPHLRATVTVKPGNVFTIEPGLYFIPGLLEPLRKSGAAVDWKRVDELMPFGGIRIEDNVAVRAGGNKNLTRDNWPSPS